MKTADDFRRALGEGDEGFHRRVQATLAALPEEEPVVKKKMSVGLAIAFAAPKPATARPVARPFLSLNHSISVLTGER